MPARPQVPQALVSRLGAICTGLPEVVEQQAWTGRRWSVRGKNFAHVVMIDAGWPPAYAKAAGTDGPACVLTFRLPAHALDSPRFMRAPYFRPPWFANIAGLVLGDRSDWDDIELLLAGSYRVLAPKTLLAKAGL
ncbi:MAG: MmcQ/YjbR family DNA-binding protein [Comamonadaceae bacterium]|nr:MAG: MmcQ/YjbR family DNA-binding protein [Comamonadaceae bacterium]